MNDYLKKILKSKNCSGIPCSKCPIGKQCDYVLVHNGYTTRDRVFQTKMMCAFTDEVFE